MLTSESLWVIVDALVTSIDGLRVVLTTTGVSRSSDTSVPSGAVPSTLTVLLMLPVSAADCSMV